MSEWQRRRYQQVALVAARKTRVLGLFWARQCRKSTTLGEIAFDEMSRDPGRRVIAASASLLLGTELVTKAVTAAEQSIIVGREAAALQSAMIHSAAYTTQPLQLVAADAQTDRPFASVSAEDFTDLYQSGRLEMRLYHDRATYSRLQVIAPNPATARGWSGTVLRDEVGYVKQEAQLQEATKPIIDTDPSFRMIYASNLPFDDRHPWFEMTMPADPALEFPPNPDGHFYRSATHLRIHRVSIADAYAAGHVLYDDDGQAMTLERAFATAVDKAAWRRSYSLIHEFGGAAAIDLLAMSTAQQRGIGKCACIVVDSDADFERALTALRLNLGSGSVGIGCDVATTTRSTSNPTSVTVTEEHGFNKSQALVVLWKERNPKVARERLRRIIQAVHSRPAGPPPRRFCIDGSNERYFAKETADEFRGLIPVAVVNASDGIQPTGYEKPTNMKTWLGDLYSAEINDNRYALPPEAYLKEDHRLVLKDRGAYTCEPQPDGKHGDTFDSGKLAQYALHSGGPAEASGAQVGSYGRYDAAREPDRLRRMRPDPREDAVVESGHRMT
jgi:hypothetical protein